MASAMLSNLGAENSCRYGLTSSRWHSEEVSEISSMAENIPKYSRSLAHAVFSGAVFTCAQFQKNPIIFGSC